MKRWKTFRNVIGKKVLSMVCSIVMCGAMLSSETNMITAQAAAHTQSDAVNWAMGQIGKGLDYDGVYGNQCVDLIKYYYDYFGVANYATGNANAYITNTLPAGWTRVYGNYQPGDIAVWKTNHSCSTCSTSSLGHVGIITSADSVGFNAVNQNFNSQSFCTKNWFNVSALACAIRPSYAPADTTPPVISDVKVSDVSANSYTVTCTVSDNIGVTAVRFPTWSEINGQDDLVWYEGTVNGNTASITINTSEHGMGGIITHIYAYDAVGNYSKAVVSIIREYTPVTVTTYQNHVYAMFDNVVTWEDAKAACESMGGHLVTITSEEEGRAVKDMVHHSKGVLAHYYTGLQRSGNSWRWVTTEPYEYSDWLEDQPDNAGNVENYMDIWKNGDGWNDIGQKSAGFILEIEREWEPMAKGAFEGNELEVYYVTMPYEVAEKYCEVHNQHLVVIDSAEKNKYVTELAAKGDREKFYIGTYREEGSLLWKTVTGDSQKFSNWADKQPDNYMGLQRYAAMCLNGTWDDEFVYKWNIGFISEKEIEEPENPTEPDSEPSKPSSEPESESPEPSSELESELPKPSAEPSSEPESESPEPSSESESKLPEPSSEPESESSEPSAEPGSEPEEKEITYSMVGLSSVEYNWDGEIKTPAVSVVDNGTVLVEGKDYTVTYESGRKNIGFYEVTVTGIGDYIGEVSDGFNITLQKGKVYEIGGLKYKLLSENIESIYDAAKVSIAGAKTKMLSSLVVKDSVKIGGVTCRITGVNNNAFKKYTRLQKVTLGKNITRIGTGAFYGCSKLKSIQLKGTKLKTVSKNAIKGIYKRAVIKVPSSCVSKYMKLFKSTTGKTKYMKIAK